MLVAFKLYIEAGVEERRGQFSIKGLMFTLLRDWEHCT